MFSVSIEDRILRMPAGEDGDGGGDDAQRNSARPTPTDPTPSPSIEEGERRAQQQQKEIKSQDEIYERIVKNIEKSRELYDIDAKRYDTLKDVSSELQNQLTFGNSQLNQIGSLSNQLQTLLDKKTDLSEEEKAQVERAKEGVQAEQKKLETMAKELGIELKLSKLNFKIEKGKALTADQAKEASKAAESDKARLEKALEAQKKIDSVGKKILGNTKLSANAGDTMLGQYEGILSNLGEISGDGKGLDLVTKMMGKTFHSAFNFKNVLYKAVEFSFDLALQIEKVSKELGEATGFGNEFADQIGRIGNNLTMIGGDEADAAEMIKALTNNISSFNPAAGNMNTSLATSVFELKKYGVSAGTSAKTIDVLEKAMGKTTEQAVEMTAQLAITGRKLGITTEKMVANFGTAYERVALFGSQGNTVFKELSSQVKATGIEMSKLLDISKKFDTFAGAADQVSQLNAALGTNLSSIEMLNATDSERIEIIKREVRTSVGNFDNLGKYEKMYVQQAMGVNSVEEAQRLLNMSQSEYLKNNTKQQEAADAQAELARNASELVPALTKLTSLVLKFFKLFTPFVGFFELIGVGIDKFFALFPVGTKDSKELAATLEFLKFVILAVGAAFLYATAPVSAIVIAVMALFGAMKKLYDIAHRPGSRSMAGGLFDKDIGASMGRMADDADGVSSSISGTTKSLEDLHASAHSIEGNKIDITAMANMDTNKIAAGIKSVKSALMELSTLKIDGFLAMTTDGSETSFAMASEGVIKSLSEGKLTVDVNMPELTLPPINIVIESKGTNLADLIDVRIEKRGVK